MPVDDEINLDDPDGITEEDIIKMEAQANDLEILAEKAEAAKEKIKEAAKPLEGMNFAQLNIIDNALSGKAVGQVGAGDLVGMDKEKLMDIIIEILKTIEKEKKKNDDQEKEIDEMKERIKEVRGNMQKISGLESEIRGFTSSPIGFAKGKALGFLGKAGLYGMIAQFVINQLESFYNDMVSEIKGWYKDGGPLDRRKMVEDVLKEYNSISYLTKIKSGQVFFTADAGRELYQGVPRGSDNTRNLRDGHLRYMQLHFNE